MYGPVLVFAYRWVPERRAAGEWVGQPGWVEVGCPEVGGWVGMLLRHRSFRLLCSPDPL